MLQALVVASVLLASGCASSAADEPKSPECAEGSDCNAADVPAPGSDATVTDDDVSYDSPAQDAADSPSYDVGASPPDEDDGTIESPPPPPPDKPKE